MVQKQGHQCLSPDSFTLYMWTVCKFLNLSVFVFPLGNGESNSRLLNVCGI